MEERLEIDGVTYEGDFVRSIRILSQKYGYKIHIVAPVCLFFHDLMFDDWRRVADMFLKSCKDNQAQPIEILNDGVSLLITASHRN